MFSLYTGEAGREGLSYVNVPAGKHGIEWKRVAELIRKWLDESGGNSSQNSLCDDQGPMGVNQDHSPRTFALVALHSDASQGNRDSFARSFAQVLSQGAQHNHCRNGTYMSAEEEKGLEQRLAALEIEVAEICFLLCNTADNNSNSITRKITNGRQMIPDPTAQICSPSINLDSIQSCVIKDGEMRRMFSQLNMSSTNLQANQESMWGINNGKKYKNPDINGSYVSPPRSRVTGTGIEDTNSDSKNTEADITHKWWMIRYWL